MFRPLLGHLQAVWENMYKIYLYFNALCDPKCLYKYLGSHSALKYRQLLDLFSQRASGWRNKRRNMSPWQCTIFIVYKTQIVVLLTERIYLNIEAT